MSADPLPARGGSDLLGLVLEGVGLESHLGPRLSLTAPWSFRSGDDLPAGLYAVTRGAAWMQSNGGINPIRLTAGDIVLFMAATAHTFAAEASGCQHPRRVIPQAWLENHRMRTFGGGGPGTQLVRGSFRFGGPGMGPLLALLAPVLHLRHGGEPPAPWLAAALDATAGELPAGVPGERHLSDLLVRVVLAQAVRTSLLRATDTQTAQLAAILDPQIGPVLRLMHTHPGEPWSVATLAREANLSRSLFAARFSALTGQSPMRYLLDCRMRAACAFFRAGGTGVKGVAHEVGYASEPAFSSAFKRWSGRSPGAYRGAATARVS